MKVSHFIFFSGLIAATASGHRNLSEKFAWRQLDFAWDSDATQRDAVTSQKFIAENNLPLAFDIWNDKIFLTVPRWKNGIASSLNYIDINDKKSNPVLHPFPSWQMNQLEDGTTDIQPKIVSSFGIRADECDRLWVVDSGISQLLTKPEKIQSPSIFIFNLKSNTTDQQLLRHFEIPSNQIKSDSFFVNVFVDVSPGRCDEAFAYILDIYGYGIIVYDFNRDKSWRVNHNFFAFDPVMGDLNVDGLNFQWHDGIFSMALGDFDSTFEDRILYFHALASLREFSVSNKVLKNESLATNPQNYHNFKMLGVRGDNMQSSMEVFDKSTGVIFYTLINKNAIGCWNTKKSYSIENQGIVAMDNENLIFPNDLRLDGHGNLLVLSNKMPRYMYKKLFETEINFRILIGNTKDIIKDTPCE